MSPRKSNLKDFHLPSVNTGKGPAITTRMEACVEFKMSYSFYLSYSSRMELQGVQRGRKGHNKDSKRVKGSRKDSKMLILHGLLIANVFVCL